MEIIDIPGTGQKIYRDDKGFNFGIDAILLSSFAKMKRGKNLIDIGTGSGILSLRCKAMYSLSRVVALEIQEDVAKRAEKSFRLNGENIELIHGNMTDYMEEFRDFDYIISNPPYLKKDDTIYGISQEQRISRCEIHMNSLDLFRFSKKSLKNNGILYLIHRPHRLPELIVQGKEQGLILKRMKMVHSKLNQGAKMVLLEFVKNAKEHLTIESPLIIYDNGHYTKEVLQYYGKV
ncbi:MAG: methyltransferase [Tissierellia bacterium]|nr:methyltransferase [Tissierellia bacterium]